MKCINIVLSNIIGSNLKKKRKMLNVGACTCIPIVQCTYILIFTSVAIRGIALRVSSPILLTYARSTRWINKCIKIIIIVVRLFAIDFRFSYVRRTTNKIV